jgi:hypothetical protein
LGQECRSLAPCCTYFSLVGHFKENIWQHSSHWRMIRK